MNISSYVNSNVIILMKLKRILNVIHINLEQESFSKLNFKAFVTLGNEGKTHQWLNLKPREKYQFSVLSTRKGLFLKREGLNQ